MHRKTLIFLTALLCLSVVPLASSASDASQTVGDLALDTAPVCPVAAADSLPMADQEPPPTCDPVACSIECGGFGICRGGKCRCGI